MHELSFSHTPLRRLYRSETAPNRDGAPAHHINDNSRSLLAEKRHFGQIGVCHAPGDKEHLKALWEQCRQTFIRG